MENRIKIVSQWEVRCQFFKLELYAPHAWKSHHIG